MSYCVCRLCFLVAILFTGLVLGCAKKPRAVIFISLDTLRQDHLGCYGYKRDTSPNIDRFAKEDAILFEAAYAQAPYTLPSHMSMLTGLYPETHGILTPVVPGTFDETNCLAPHIITLAESLKKQGFKTEAFTDGMLVDGKYGFDQGFDQYRDKHKIKSEKNGFRKYKNELHSWIKNNSKSDFFLFIHTYDTHSPYPAPEPHRSKFKKTPPGCDAPQGSMLQCSMLGFHDGYNLLQHESFQSLVDVYDGCISYVDHEVGELFKLLKEHDLWEEAVVVVTTDHGELLMENGLMIGHGLMGYNGEVLIPMLIKLPKSRFYGLRESHVVESVDLMPTILAALDIPSPKDVQGQDIIRGVEEGDWKKDYAFGISPNTGGNRYFFRKGIKYIEAVRDNNKFDFLLCHLRPKQPMGWLVTPPKENNVYYYDIKLDPLGAAELFHRGDRIYDLRDVDYEWQANEITERETLRKYKLHVSALSKICKSAVASPENVNGEGDKQNKKKSALTKEEIEQLNALGYGGIINLAQSLNAPGGDSNNFKELLITEPLVNLDPLYKADHIFWRTIRILTRRNSPINKKNLIKKFAETKKEYEEFAIRYPNKKNLVEWRLKLIEQAVEYIQNRKKSEKPATPEK